MRRINGAHADCNAEPFQRRLEEQHHALEARILAQQFESELRSGLDIDQLAVVHLIAGLFQQMQRFAQIVPHRFRIAADRIGIGRREHFRGHLRANGFEDFKLPALRQAAGREFSAVEITFDALVLIEENLLVHFLEVECEIQRAAHPRIGELVAADIQRERLHAAGTAIGELFL